jgi:TPR repeat protein
MQEIKDETVVSYKWAYFGLFALLALVAAMVLFGDHEQSLPAGQNPDSRSPQVALPPLTDHQSKVRDAEAGDSAKQFDLALDYRFGRGIARDDSEANRWLIRSAEKGHMFAMRLLEEDYLKGEHVTRDTERHLFWLKKCAEAGILDSQVKLVGYYFNGTDFLAANPIECLRWGKSAADAGSSYAQCIVGIIYGTGKGVPRDYAEALKWYRLAAQNGEATAQFNLGVLHWNGYGVPVDLKQAAEFYKKSAEAGSVSGHAQFGFALMHGKGVEKNLSEGVRHTKIAASNAIPNELKAFAWSALAPPNDASAPSGRVKESSSC